MNRGINNNQNKHSNKVSGHPFLEQTVLAGLRNGFEGDSRSNKASFTIELK